MAELHQAMHENLLRAVMRVGALTERARAERVEPWLLIDSGTAMAPFNIALVASEPVADAAEALATARSWFGRQRSGFQLILRDDADAVLIASAGNAGFEELEREPAMALTPLPPTEPLLPGFATRQALTAEDIRCYGEVDARSLHEITLGIARTAAAFPDFTLWLGELDGQPVATAMAVHTGDMIGIYNVQVKDHLRGRGLGRAMTLAAIEAGRARGARVASLQSSELGLSVYNRLGFETRYSYVTLAPKS